MLFRSGGVNLAGSRPAGRPVVETVRCRFCVAQKEPVGDIGNGFRSRAKEGWGVFPPHGDARWNSDQLGFTGEVRKNNGELWGGVGVNLHAVVTIS